MNRDKINIKLSQLTTGYGEKRITKDIDAALQAGSLTCLIGPNGAGKSTLLRTLCGFIPPLEGDVTIGDASIKQIKAKELAQLVSVVLTERPSAMNMTVEELVAMGRSPYTGFWGQLRDDDRRIVDEAIALVGIEGLKSRSIATLSDGERQKTLIAKALAQKTPVIFLDEPTAFLDYPSKVEIMLLLYRIARNEGKTVFMSTHDLEIALQIADSLWLLDRQKGLRIGSPAALAADGTLASYFESPSLSFDPSRLSFRIAK